MRRTVSAALAAATLVSTPALAQQQQALPEWYEDDVTVLVAAKLFELCGVNVLLAGNKIHDVFAQMDNKGELPPGQVALLDVEVRGMNDKCPAVSAKVVMQGREAYGNKALSDAIIEMLPAEEQAAPVFQPAPAPAIT